VVISVAQGLQAIHKAGVIHRDLKTANIMIDRHGVVRVLDFGVAKQSGADTTSVGAVIGTPEYMSPEQGRGQPVDFRCDIYALGVVIYEVFAGVVPFRGDTAIAIILKHLNDPPPFDGLVASGVPAPVLPILARALAKDPADRYQATHEVLEALEEARFECYPLEAPAPAARVRGTAATWPRIEACVVADDEPGLTPLPVATARSVTPVEETIAERETAAMLSTPPEAQPRWARILAARSAPVALLTIVVAAVAVPLALHMRAPAPVETFHGSTPAASGAQQGVAAPPASSLPAPQAGAPAPDLPAPPFATVPPRAASAPPTSTARVPSITLTAAPEDGRGVKGTDATVNVVSEPPPRAPEPQAEEAVSTVPVPPPATLPSPQVHRGELVEPGPGVQPPVLVSVPPPDYPMLARRMGREGRVVVRVLVDETGKVLEAAVVHSDRSNVAFDAAALESARKGVFKAALKDGMPVRMWYEIPVDFRLK